jgi:hypothetical protein
VGIGEAREVFNSRGPDVARSVGPGVGVCVGVSESVADGVCDGVGEGVGKVHLTGIVAHINVAVCPARDWVMSPVGIKRALSGSYISALASGRYFWSHPPATSTLPSGSSVAE